MPELIDSASKVGRREPMIIFAPPRGVYDEKIG